MIDITQRECYFYKVMKETLRIKNVQVFRNEILVETVHIPRKRDGSDKADQKENFNSSLKSHVEFSASTKHPNFRLRKL